MQETKVIFNRKYLIKLVLPLVVEQILAVTVGMADMIMVSGAGDTAVSGGSLVNTIFPVSVSFLFMYSMHWLPEEQ